MPAQGKLLILNWVLRVETQRRFRAAELFREGLSRQLVNYHLKKLVEQRILDFEEREYWIIDREALMDQFLVEQKGESNYKTQIPWSPLWNQEQLNAINERIKLVILMRSAEVPRASEFANAMAETFDKFITNLTEVKKGMLSKTVPKDKALDTLQSDREYTEDELKKLLAFGEGFAAWYTDLMMKKSDPITRDTHLSLQELNGDETLTKEEWDDDYRITDGIKVRINNLETRAKLESTGDLPKTWQEYLETK